MALVAVPCPGPGDGLVTLTCIGSSCDPVGRRVPAARSPRSRLIVWSPVVFARNRWWIRAWVKPR
jgi:hypothetical protein